jgi:alpha-beta hydrolase superfamily lysophospholipase
MNVLWSLTIAAALGIGAVAALALHDARRLTNPPDYVHPRAHGFRYEQDPRTLFGLAFEDVSVPSHGAAMQGWLVPGASENATALIAVHGRAGDRTTPFLPLLPALHKANVAVLALDLRENGTSDGSGRGTGLAMREAEDIRSASSFLKERGYETVVVAGCSLGASAAIIAAARDRSIDGVIADSPLESFHRFVADNMRHRLKGLAAAVPAGVTDLWGHLVVGVSRLRQGVPMIDDPLDLVADIAPRPLLLIHGTNDTAVAISHSRALLARAGEPKSLWTLEGIGHCEASQKHPDAYAERVLNLIRSIARGQIRASAPGKVHQAPF